MIEDEEYIDITYDQYCLFIRARFKDHHDYDTEQTFYFDSDGNIVAIAEDDSYIAIPSILKAQPGCTQLTIPGNIKND